jgi:protein TonB
MSDERHIERRGYQYRRRKPRWGIIALIVAFHVLAVIGLARAFAPDFTASVVERATAIVTVTVTTPEEPEAVPSPDPEPEPDEGAAGAEAPDAVAREVVAPPVPVVRPSPAPRAASTGTRNVSGAGEQGAGTGAGGEGEGTGAGRSGGGRGGIPVTDPVKIAGDINDAGDYPVPPGGRQVRRGHSVVVYMTVTKEGRATDCRVVEPSPDPVADRITCELAEQRFRFRPARDAAGNPVEATYGWRQSWF